MNTSLKPPDLRQLLYISVSLVSLCVQSTILLMATSEEQASTTTWTDPKVNALLDFLLKNKSKIGESNSFTHQIYKAAADHIKPYHTLGLKKTGKSCKTKFTTICNFLLLKIGYR